MGIKIILCFAIIAARRAFVLGLLQECPEGQLLCGDQKTCVSPEALCNYVEDCSDLSDETNLKLCQKLKKNQRKCDPGMIACKNTEIAITNDKNSNNDFGVQDYHHYSRYGYRTTTTTTTTEAPKRSRYPFLSNQCLDIITACVLGEDCLGDEHTSLCQEIGGRKLSTLGSKIFPTSTDIEDMYTLLRDISVGMKNATNSPCPYFYTLFEEKCIWALPLKATWNEAKTICESTGGGLAVLKDIESFRQIRNFINYELTGSDFWIGGRYVTRNGFRLSGTWRWIDNTKLKRDALFWAKELSTEDINESESKFAIKTRPLKEDNARNCVAFLLENGYLFSDEDCSLRYSPLCVKEADVKNSAVQSPLQHTTTSTSFITTTIDHEPFGYSDELDGLTHEYENY